MLQQQSRTFPGMEVDKPISQDVAIDPIMQAKIKILSGINQVITSNTATGHPPTSDGSTAGFPHVATPTTHWPLTIPSNSNQTGMK